MDIQKKFDRIVAIFFQLQAKPIVRAQDLADRFEVSLRTIYRDIRSLENAGIPIASEAGIGYSLVDSYKLPPALFTRDEALSFTTAEKLMNTFLDKKVASDFSSALIKMKAVLRTSEKEAVASTDKHVILDRKSKEKYFNKEVPDAVNLLLKSITSHKQTSIQYIKSGSNESEDRILEPIGLFLKQGYWYFIAYCLLRKDYRQFRLDRIQKIELTHITFTKQHQELSHYLEKDKKDIPTQTIVIQVTRTMAPHLNWEKDYFGFKKEAQDGDYIRMHFECATPLEVFVRWYCMFGDQATIIEPKSLQQDVKNYLHQQLQQLENTKA